jgi:hypothetical protein
MKIYNKYLGIETNPMNIVIMFTFGLYSYLQWPVWGWYVWQYMAIAYWCCRKFNKD